MTFDLRAEFAEFFPFRHSLGLTIAFLPHKPECLIVPAGTLDILIELGSCFGVRHRNVFYDKLYLKNRASPLTTPLASLGSPPWKGGARGGWTEVDKRFFTDQRNYLSALVENFSDVHKAQGALFAFGDPL